VLVRWDMPVRVCFRISKPGFDAAPALVTATPMNLSYECQAGLYSLIRQPQRWDRTTPFRVAGDERGVSSFFLYVPDQAIGNLRLSSPYASDCIQLSKNWFLWRDKPR
jgi:hypothetical protein